MKPIRSILCPIDFSESAEVALREAVGMAERFQAELALLHVYHLPTYLAPEAMLPFPAEAAKAAEARAKLELDKLKVLAERELGRTVWAKVRLGVPYAEIVEEAQKGKHDLIVMGTHGRTGLKHFVIGSVAERVVQLAPCRVLTVPDAPKSG